MLENTGNTSHGKRSSVIAVAIILAVSLACETLLFNISFWQTMGNQPVSLLSAPTTIENENDAIQISGIDLNAKNITVQFQAAQAETPVYARYSITDDGESQPYQLPTVEMLQENERSCTQDIHPYGNLRSISISFPACSSVNEDSGEKLDANTYPIVVEAVYANTQVPFSFNLLRFLLVAAFLLFAYVFRPKGPLFTSEAFNDSGYCARMRRTVVSIAVIAACASVFAFPGWMQFATSSYNATQYSGSAAVEMTTPDWYHTFAYDEYGELARSFTQGKLYLSEQPPEWLAEVSNPFDHGIQESTAAQENYWYKVDAAYSDGHYYVYFGVVPVVLLYLPFYLLTGADLPGAFALLIGVAAFIVGLYFLLKSLTKRYFKHISTGTFLLIYIGALLCCVLMIGLGRPTLYQVPVAFARCFGVWGLYLWCEGWHRRKPALLAAGSLCIALIAGCRPQLLVFALPLIFLLAKAVKGMQPVKAQSTERSAEAKAIEAAFAKKAIVALLVPIAIIAVALMWYNAARFGSPFDFGASKNLAGNDMSLRGNVPERLVDGLFYFLVQPANITTGFPFLHVANTQATYGGITIIEPLCGGLFATLPFLWLSCAVLTFRKTRPTLFAAVLVLLVCGVVVCAFDVQAAGICGRYYQDFAVLFALAAALAALGVSERIAAAQMALDSCSDECTRVAGSPAVEGARVQSFQLQKAWRVLLLALVAICLVFTFLQFLFMESDAACNTGGGSNAILWEWLRQSFQFWT